MTPREYRETLARLIPDLERELLQAYADLDRGRRRQVEAAIRAGDTATITRLLGLDDEDAPGTFAAFLDALRDGLIIGGIAQAARIQRVVLIPLHFDTRDPRTAEWLRQSDGNLAQWLATDARDNVQRVVQDGLREGLSVADIAKRLPRIPLTEAQRQHLAAADASLGTRTTPPDRSYLTRQGRDERFDDAVRRAIDAGKPLDRRTRRAVLDAYAQKARKVRAAGIARTETTRYINAGRYEAIMQADRRGVGQRLTWISQRDARVRHIHVAMDGQQRRPGVPFDSPRGTQLRFPGDVALGAVAEDVMNCRCYLRWEPTE